MERLFAAVARYEADVAVLEACREKGRITEVEYAEWKRGLDESFEKAKQDARERREALDAGLGSAVQSSPGSITATTGSQIHAASATAPCPQPALSAPSPPAPPPALAGSGQRSATGRPLPQGVRAPVHNMKMTSLLEASVVLNGRRVPLRMTPADDFAVVEPQALRCEHCGKVVANAGNLKNHLESCETYKARNAKKKQSSIKGFLVKRAPAPAAPAPSPAPAPAPAAPASLTDRLPTRSWQACKAGFWAQLCP